MIRSVTLFRQPIQLGKRNMAIPPARRKRTYNKEQLAVGTKNTEKFIKYNHAVTSVSPMKLMTDYLPGDPGVPTNKKEVAFLGDAPAEQMRRKVLIQPKHRTSMMQGESKAHHWTITWPNQANSRWTNPLMGWTSGSDPMAAVKLQFDSREDAITYAENNGLEYTVKHPTSVQFGALGTRKYHQNFLSVPVRKQLDREGMKTKIFVNPHYGKSNWFMPLTYDGSSEVEQFGPAQAK